MVFNGRIAVDGKKLSSPAYNVEEGAKITLDGKPLPCAQPLALYLFHKPREVLTARTDRSLRTCLPNLLPASLARLKPVGRLDFLSEGLLLLTTSGLLARHLELPKNAWQRRYRLRLYGRRDEQAFARLKDLKRGTTIGGVQYRSVVVSVKKPRRGGGGSGSRKNPLKSSFWIEATLTEGKNRELRKIMGALGYGVLRLVRTHYGPFALGGLARGAYKRVADTALRETLGEEWEELAGMTDNEQRMTDNERRTTQDARRKTDDG